MEHREILTNLRLADVSRITWKHSAKRRYSIRRVDGVAVGDRFSPRMSMNL